MQLSDIGKLVFFFTVQKPNIAMLDANLCYRKIICYLVEGFLGFTVYKQKPVSTYKRQTEVQGVSL